MDDDQCMVCYEDHVYKTRFYACNHWLCDTCFNKIGKCAICNHIVVKKVCEYFGFDISVLCDGIIKNKIIGYSKVTSLIIEYFKWLKLISEFGSCDLEPSVLIESVWTMHILDTKSYMNVCGDVYLHRVGNKSIVKRNNDVVNTKRCYVDKYGGDMLNDVIWKFDELFDIGIITGRIIVSNWSGAIMYPYNKSMTRDQLIMLIEYYENDREKIDGLMLFYGGRQLWRNVALSECGVHDWSNVDVNIRLRGD